MNAPRPRTIDEVAAPFENYLTAMPSPGDGVCTVCHSAVFEGYARCYPCMDAGRRLPATAAAVASVALAPHNEQLARDLHNYKDSRLSPATRRPYVVGLAAVLYKWLHRHEGCLARAAGLQTPLFDTVTSVPSTSGRAGAHPLVNVLTEVVTGTATRYAELLEVGRTGLGARDVVPDRFAATRRIEGNVLLVDDSWVSGAKPQCAAATLSAGGAERVAVLTIGRWFRLDHPPNVPWLRERRRPWSWDDCCVH